MPEVGASALRSEGAGRQVFFATLAAREPSPNLAHTKPAAVPRTTTLCAQPVLPPCLHNRPPARLLLGGLRPRALAAAGPHSNQGDGKDVLGYSIEQPAGLSSSLARAAAGEWGKRAQRSKACHPVPLRAW
eukprot:773837-Pelagomonas_calceolata.AAC.5